MTTSAKAVHLDSDSLWVHLDDGRVISVPLAWFPRLLNATPEQRAQFEISPRAVAQQRYDKLVASGRSVPWSEMRRYLEDRAAGVAGRPPAARKQAR